MCLRSTFTMASKVLKNLDVGETVILPFPKLVCIKRDRLDSICWSRWNQKLDKKKTGNCLPKAMEYWSLDSKDDSETCLLFSVCFVVQYFFDYRFYRWQFKFYD